MNKVCLSAFVLSMACGCGAGEPASPGNGVDLGLDAASGPGSDPTAGGATLDAGGTATGYAGDGGSTGVSRASPNTGLPCDVLALLQAHCVSCHSSPPVGGAPMPLVTYADLTAMAKSAPTKTVAQMALSRMQSTTAPMPPAGVSAPTPPQMAAFQSWVGAGTPPGTCGAPDAGVAGNAGGGGSGASVYATPVQCSSGHTWSGETDPSMRPGDTCVSCHARSDSAPRFTIAGTVYKTAHEPNSCDGVNVLAATVIVTDANNQMFKLAVNSVGNFYTTQAVAMPFHARVVYGGNVRAMAPAQTSGDCNSCHTQSGANGAPGRIMLP